MNAAEQYLHDRGLTRETWERSKLELYETEIEAPWDRLNLGARKIQLIHNHVGSSIWIPCFGPNGTEEASWMVRALLSSGCKLPKFLAVRGKRSPVWISPKTRVAAKEIGAPVFVTEGAIKAMALAQAGVCAIGIIGVWGLAEPNGKTAENGEKKKKYRLREELESFRWLSRRVYLCFDSDQLGNSDVRQAAIRSFFLLSIAGAEFYQLEWPDSQAKGIDDYLRAAGENGAGENDREAQASALAGIVATAKPFVDSLTQSDVDLYARELAKVEMSPARREQLAGLATKKLGTTKSALLVSSESRAEDRKQISFPRVEPCEFPVNGKELIAELRALIHKHIFLTDEQALTIALWVLWSYLVQEDFVEVSPYLGITAADKRCGKSRLLDLIERLVPRGYVTSDVSSSSFFRLVELGHPTLLVDEFHRLVGRNQAVLDIYIKAFDRNRRVLRTNLETMQPEEFDIWGARAIAYLGKLDDQLYDRVIEIYLKRKPRKEGRARLRETPRTLTEALQSRCQRWVKDNLPKIRKTDPTDLDCSSDRAADSWRVLLAIAQVIDPKTRKADSDNRTKAGSRGTQR